MEITFNTDNAAFWSPDTGLDCDELPGEEFNTEEVACILESIAASVRAGIESDSIRDRNGNTVGNWSLDR